MHLRAEEASDAGHCLIDAGYQVIFLLLLSPARIQTHTDAAATTTHMLHVGSHSAAPI